MTVDTVCVTAPRVWGYGCVSSAPARVRAAAVAVPELSGSGDELGHLGERGQRVPGDEVVAVR